MSSIVVALYESKGEADNARHRLVSEGINEGDIGERVLHEVGPLPLTMEPEIVTMNADPFDNLFFDIRKSYEAYIKNGETALAVMVPDDEQAEAVESIMMMFEPVRVDRLTPLNPMV
jgi:hypothetical protein